MTQTVADLIATARPQTTEVSVCARGDLVEAHAAAVSALAAAVQAGEEAKSLGTAVDPEIEALHDRIVEIEAEQADSTITFQVSSVGSLAWHNLLRSHPPRRVADHGLAWNLATFPPAAVAACVVSPSMSLEEATTLYGSDTEPGALPSAEWDKLFAAAYKLNEIETPHPKLPAAIENLLRSVRSSTTAAEASSPDPRSLADSVEQ